MLSTILEMLAQNPCILDLSDNTEHEADNLKVNQKINAFPICSNAYNLTFAVCCLFSYQIKEKNCAKILF